MSSYPPAFYDAVAAGYGERWTIEEEVRRVAADLAGATARTVELGCGNGRLLRNLPAGTVGLDFSSAMLALAARRDPDAPLVRADARRLPLRLDGRTVMVVNVLHNLSDPEVLLREIARAGATTLITDHRNRWNPIVLVKDLLRRNQSYRAVTAASMARLLRRAGFTPTRRRPVRRPLTDPGEGFRPRHLLGALISLLPGLAPCYAVEAIREVRHIAAKSNSILVCF